MFAATAAPGVQQGERVNVSEGAAEGREAREEAAEDQPVRVELPMETSPGPIAGNRVFVS